VNGTLVLSFGEEIEEIPNSGFLSSEPTLAAQQLGQDAILQVHPRGVRHVLSDKRFNEWRAPSGLTIVAATTNKRQVVVALSTAELVYFELDTEGQLNEYQDRKAMGSTVLALSVGEVPEGLQRFKYLVGRSTISSSTPNDASSGRRVRGSNCPYHLFGSRLYTGDDQSSGGRSIG
jgi:splicing factor 3B subunit 3